jgi:hypothetical protein
MNLSKFFFVLFSTLFALTTPTLGAEYQEFVFPVYKKDRTQELREFVKYTDFLGRLRTLKISDFTILEANTIYQVGNRKYGQIVVGEKKVSGHVIEFRKLHVGFTKKKKPVLSFGEWQLIFFHSEPGFKRKDYVKIRFELDGGATFEYYPLAPSKAPLAASP